MYKYLISVLFVLLFSSPVFAWDYFCSVKEDVIKISINPSVGVSCDDYLSNLDLLLVNTAKEMVDLNSLIKQGRDADYWLNVRDQKQLDIQKYSLLKDRILTHIDKFSYTFFIKIRDYVILSIKDDIQTYIKTFKRIQWFQENYQGYPLSENLEKYQDILVDVLEVVQDIYTAEDTDEILEHYRKYIYFKEVLKWRSE